MIQNEKGKKYNFRPGFLESYTTGLPAMVNVKEMNIFYSLTKAGEDDHKANKISKRTDLLILSHVRNLQLLVT